MTRNQELQSLAETNTPADVALRAASAIEACLRSQDSESLRIYLESALDVDVAAILDRLSPEHAARCLRLLALPERARVYSHLVLEHQVALTGVMKRGELAELVSAMSHDDRADLFKRLDEEQQAVLLPGLAQAEREDVRRLASYREGTAGAVMTSDYATLSPDLTAREAIEALRREAPDRETIYDAYVIDGARRLLGVVSLRDLILSPPTRLVSDLMQRNVVFAHVDDAREKVAATIAHYDLFSLPIVNGGDALVGIVTHDDAMDVQQEEATEDFHKAGTVGKLDQSPRVVSLFVLYRKRIPWLVILVFGNVFSGAGIALYEETIARYVTLVFFLPLLIDSGGNAGSQASTLMVRALATGGVELRDWARMLGRDVRVAGGLGLTMAFAVSAVGLFRGGPGIALVVASTMVIVVLVGSLIGTVLPFLLSRLRLDPATASGPLITSIADAVGVIIYFAIATALLPQFAA